MNGSYPIYIGSTVGYYGQPIVAEQPKRVEYSNDEKFIRHLENQLENRKDEILQVEIARLNNSRERRDVQSALKRYNGRVKALDKKHNEVISVLQAEIEKKDEYVEECKEAIEQRAKEMASTLSRFWSAATKKKHRLELQTQMENYQEYLEEAQELTKKLAQEIEDKTEECNQQIMDERTHLYESIDGMPGGDKIGMALKEDDILIHIDFTIWARVNLKDKFEELNNDYQKKIDNIMEKLIEIPEEKKHIKIEEIKTEMEKENK